jgi:hypothetical protein
MKAATSGKRRLFSSAVLDKLTLSLITSDFQYSLQLLKRCLAVSSEDPLRGSRAAVVFDFVFDCFSS